VVSHAGTGEIGAMQGIQDMSVLPQSRQGRLEYFEARVNTWTTNAAAIGITPAQATAVKNAAGTNRTDFNAMMVARDAAKSSTNTFYTTNNTLVDLGRDMIKTIKAFAATTNNPMVYSLANIDPPAPPTPVPAPDVPANLTGSVTADGVVTLTWKATPSGASSGIFFIVERKRASEANYSVLTATVEKAAMDPAAHVEASQVQYRVKAVRGADMSEWTTPVSFNFAGGGGGFAVTSGELKMAA
jgi:hypothetical protein